MKYLLLTLFGVVLWWSLRYWRRRGAAGGRVEDRGAGEAMVACSHCGVHVPLSDMVRDARGLPYCGEAHRSLGPAAGDKG
ncbi:PP0621 family protein [Azovibrio restrictus]|uniref:PP0621 family protein n=1 Tax=Azovibrio restrictus TaxID=146938 RepID=UPI0026F20D8A|nr:PP0621 family protein [Azovibrio restrictus]